jgi:uncharacterized protein YndB with AHSA1/START domain
VPDIAMAGNIDADPETVFRAISTSEGVRGWFTSEVLQSLNQGGAAPAADAFPVRA